MTEFNISKLPKARREALLRAEEYASRKGIVIPRNKSTNNGESKSRIKTVFIPKTITKTKTVYVPRIKKIYVPKYIDKETPLNTSTQEFDRPLSSTNRERLLELVYRVVMKESLGFSYGEIAKQLENEGWDVIAGRISSRKIIESFKKSKKK